jgi:hypothetical protein
MAVREAPFAGLASFDGAPYDFTSPVGAAFEQKLARLSHRI